MSPETNRPAVDILGVPQSIYVRTVRMACAEKGVAARLIPVAPHSPEVLAINPFGTIPALRHGAVALFESKAIASYLDAVFKRSAPRSSGTSGRRGGRAVDSGA